ncbi:hypothetical protein Halar_1391 [halophilic archaeon DL31]|jgi:hypothetical protein|nr:hypothetical protein Halar_1391 [halophilic archaeon DL31]
MIPLATDGTVLPAAETGGVALLLSLLFVVGWTLYFYR